MTHHGGTLTAVTLAVAMSLGAACATVPKEVVELSYRMGEDLQSVRTSYLALVHAHFEALRRNRVAYIDDEWAPLFIRNWVDDGQLLNVANGTVVWSEAEGDFVAPGPGTAPADLLLTVRQWAQAAVEQIDKKERELLAPLDAEEASLTASIDDAFAQLTHGNAAVTAHLNSLRKVQEVQNQALAALNVRDLRDKVNAVLIRASDEAQNGLDRIRAADGIVKAANDLRAKGQSVGTGRSADATTNK